MTAPASNGLNPFVPHPFGLDPLGFDPFGFVPSDHVTPDVVRELLVENLERTEPSAVFRAFAYGLASVMAPVLAWAHNRAGVPLTRSQILHSLRYEALAALVERRVFREYDATGAVLREVPVGGGSERGSEGEPEDTVAPVRAYLGVLPGYDPDQAPGRQRALVADQHAYAVACFVRALGHDHGAGVGP